MLAIISRVYHKMIPKNDFFIWAASGPLLLFLAFALLHFKANLELWPFVLIASIGLFTCFLFQRNGFYASLAALLGLAAYEYPFLMQEPYCALFLAGTALSWGIVILGQEEIFSWKTAELKEKVELEEKNQFLQEQINQLHRMQSLDRLPFEFKAALASRDAAIESQHRSFEEMDKLRQKCNSLQEEIVSYQRKESAFQVALEDAQQQVMKYKYAPVLEACIVNPIISTEDEKIELPSQMRLLEQQYALLKEQFEEKSDALHQVRKELFCLETQLLLNQKQEIETALSSDSNELCYQMQIQDLMAHCEDLEKQVQNQEEIISSFLLKKKIAKPRTARPRGKKKELDALLQEAIDQKSNQYSLDLLQT